MPAPEALILRDIPTSFPTPRLRAVALTPGDGLALLSAVRESRGMLFPWLAIGQQVKSDAAAETYVREAWGCFLRREQFHFGLWRRRDRQFTGCICLHYGRWDVPCFEIGVWIRSSEEGQGYATEAAQGILTYGFNVLELARIEVRCDHRNLRSQAIAERLGFAFEGRLRAYVRALDGMLIDEMVYARLRKDSR